MAHLNDSKYSWTASQVPAASGGVSGLERAWLQEVSGSTGHLNDQWNEYLTSLGYTTGALPDKMGAWLTAEGYAGSLSDKLAAFFRDFYQSFVTQSTLNGTFTRASGALWQDSDNNLRTAGLNIPVFDGRRYVSPTESSPYDLSGNLIAGLKGISIHPAIVNKCQTYGFIPDDEEQTPLTSGLMTGGNVYKIIAQSSTTSFVADGASNPHAIGDTFVAADVPSVTLTATDSVALIKYAVGTKSYHDGTSFIQNIDGMTLSGDVAGVLSIVDDGTQLDADGWGGAESNGKCLFHNNVAGSTWSLAVASGFSVNTNPHIASAVGKTISAVFNVAVEGDAGENFLSEYSYISNQFTPPSPKRLQIAASAGGSGNFLLPGLYERSTAPRYPVPANSLTTSTTQSGAVLELPFPTGSRRAVINYVHYALELGVTRWLFGNYTDANNYVGGGIDGTIAFIEKKSGGVSEITSLPLAPVTDTEYEVIAGFNPDNTMFITVDGATHTVDGSTTLAPVLASTFELGSMDGSGQVEGQFKSIQIRRG